LKPITAPIKITGMVVIERVDGKCQHPRLVYLNTRFVVQFDAHRLLLEALARFFCSNFV
jgi:hypothetical protein